jgi:hypothetical protein
VSAVVPVRVIAAAGDERATGAVRTRRVVARLLLPLVADRAEVGIVSVAVQTIAEAVRAHIGGHPDDSRPRSSCVSHNTGSVSHYRHFDDSLDGEEVWPAGQPGNGPTGTDTPPRDRM